MKKSRVPLTGAAVACLVLPLGGVPALAGPNSPAPQADGVEVIASGLANPRGLAFSRDGHLYVAQAGSGRASGEPERCYVGGEGIRICLGATGKISRLDVDDG